MACVDTVAQQITDYILSCAKRFIPILDQAFPNKSHPWLTDECIGYVARKHSTEGTSGYDANRNACTEALLQGYKDYAARTKTKISALPVSSNKWWKLCGALMVKSSSSCNVPPLQGTDGVWALSPSAKAEVLAKSFQSKFTLAEGIDDDSTVNGGAFESGFLLVRTRWTLQLLSKLGESSATGPDGIPSRVLKYCARELAYPITKLVRLILAVGEWPKLWRIHWILPLFKRKSRSCPDNYRGIHLTSQLSKVVERFVGNLFLPRVQALEFFGPRQIAYSRGRNYKDALLICVSDWIWALGHKCRIALYYSDVAGAFDRVSTDRLVFIGSA